MTSTTITPHLDFPFVMATQPGGVFQANTNEQDSLDDIMASVKMITACPAGGWVDQPAYGVPTMPFSATPDSLAYAQAISRCEPRAAAVASEYPDLLDPSLWHVHVQVAGQTPDQ